MDPALKIGEQTQTNPRNEFRVLSSRVSLSSLRGSLSFRGAEGDEESRISFIFSARFPADDRNDRSRDLFPQPALGHRQECLMPKPRRGARLSSRHSVAYAGRSLRKGETYLTERTWNVIENK